MFSLIVIHDQTSVNDAGNPPGKRQEKAQDKTEDAAGHEDGDRRKSNAKEIAQGLHAEVESLKRNLVTTEKASAVASAL